MEWGLFLCRPDIVVVFHQDIPIFAIEVKQPLSHGDSLKDAQGVLGQAFDYAMLLQATGLTKAYVVILTFEESMLCWPKDSAPIEYHSANNHSKDDSNQEEDSSGTRVASLEGRLSIQTPEKRDHHHL
jgi:hypothetical protein